MGRITLKEVAARAGVSYQTVSKVLNGRAQVTGETEARIWAAVEALGYEPNISARNLRLQASNLIGYPWMQPAEPAPRPILDQFFHAAALNFEKEGYHLLTFLVQAGDEADVTLYKELYGRRQVAGFILADTNRDDARVAWLIERGIPFASFGRANENWDFCWVDVDGCQGVRAVVRHLVERGHRRLALLTWPEGSQAGVEREKGFALGLQEAGLERRPEWVLRGENRAHFGAEGIAHFLSLSAAVRPTAVVCVSDLIAIGALNGAAAAGLRVGQDIAITGFDDMPTARFFTPPLTTVGQNIRLVGQHIAGLLLKQIRDEPIAQKGILTQPELIVRGSS